MPWMPRGPLAPFVRPARPVRAALLALVARPARLGLLALAAACASPRDEKRSEIPDPELMGDVVAKEAGDPDYALVQRTHANVRHYEELRQQGEMQQMVALHRNIGRTVDEHFATFRRLALDPKESALARNSAVASLGFAIERRKEAREVLETLLADAKQTWLLANACLGLGVLADPDTDLTRVIPLVSGPEPEIRTAAATCLRDIWRVRETPRRLTPQHFAAIDRLVALLNDKSTTRGRIAAAWALASLRHPDVLDYLLVAVRDDEETVQIGGLYGISLLGDARAIEPLLAFLEEGPGSEPASWAKKALVSIAVQNGFAQTPAELDALGTNGKAWRKWFRAQRNR